MGSKFVGYWECLVELLCIVLLIVFVGNKVECEVLEGLWIVELYVILGKVGCIYCYENVGYDFVVVVNSFVGYCFEFEGIDI